MRSTFFVLVLLATLLLIPLVAAEDALEWNTKGQAAAAAGDHTAAITYYNNALALDPKYAPALSGKAASLNAQRKYADALVAADAALALRGSDAVALNARALALFKMGNYNESVTAYDKLFEVQVISMDAYCNQGYAYFKLQNYDAAVFPFDRCVIIDPQNFMAWNNMGYSYMAGGKYDKALDAFDRGTGVTVKNATLWNNKGEALMALERPQDALECFKKALGIDPNFVKAKENRENAMNKQQVIQIKGTITPVLTISRIGTLYSTPTPVPVVTAVPTSVQMTGEPGSPDETVPVAKRTTYSPISPLTILAALSLAGAVLCMTRK